MNRSFLELATLLPCKRKSKCAIIPNEVNSIHLQHKLIINYIHYDIINHLYWAIIMTIHIIGTFSVSAFYFTFHCRCFKFAFEDIREVHKRRYLLQPIAIEVFSADGRNFLLAFPRKVRNKVYARYLTVATGITDSAQESLHGQRQNAKVEPGWVE